MGPAVLDTDILSEILRGKNVKVADNARNYRRLHGRYTLSVVTVVEIIQGFAQHQREDRILDFQARIAGEEVLPLDRAAADIAGRIFGELDRLGQPIGRADPLIAAIALRHGLMLVTGNTQHFERIVNLGFPLKLVNWRS
jgi:predicted nucleic acid-binding protein